VARAVSRPLNEAVSVAERVAQGDLTVDIRSDSKDETGMLMHSLRAMNDSLHKIVSEVRMAPMPSPPPRRRSPPATWTCPRAPKSRPAPWKKPPRPWKN
jgi:hypothetical protein